MAAPDEDRTRDLRIMRPTRCQLRHRGMARLRGMGDRSEKKKESNFVEKQKQLRHGESNPGHLRDRQRCYQLHHDGRSASSEDRTRDLALTKRMLCQLSYRGLFRPGRLNVRRSPHAALWVSGRGAVAMRS